MKRIAVGTRDIAIAGTVYFILVFGVGFALGVLRTVLLAPRVGVRAAELMEMPFMILATILAARWLVYCFRRAAQSAPLQTGLFALLLLVIAEIALGRLQGRTAVDFITDRDPVSGSAYFVALALFGLMPQLVARAGNKSRVPGQIDNFMSEADVAECHEIIVRAPSDLVFRTAEQFDLLSIPLVHAIFRLREIVFGMKPKPRAEGTSLVAETAALGWRQLAYRGGRELVMGAATQPWVGDVKFRGIAPESFRSFAEPRFVKIAWTFESDPVDAQTTRFRSQTRVIATDDYARRKFLRYWVFAGIFIVLIRKLANRGIRRAAEDAARGTARAERQHGSGGRYAETTEDRRFGASGDVRAQRFERSSRK